MSEFWLRKMETFFERIDIDKDGTITVKDFEAMADKLVASGKLNEERGNKLKVVIVEGFEKFLKSIAGDAPLTKDVFLNTLKQVAKSKDLPILGANMFPLFFASIDTDSDGSINEKEFIAFFNILDIAEDMAKISFNAMDTDGDGMLSEEEFVAAGVEFISGDDESSLTKFFMGPLV